MNKPSPRLAILRAELARKAVTLQCDRMLYASSAQNPRVNRALPPVAEDLPLPPTFYEDLAEWLKMPRTQPARKTPQPAAPAAQPRASAWRRGTDIPVSERVGLWHYWPSNSGRPGLATSGFSFMMSGKYRPAATGTKEGDHYDESRYTAQSARLADAGSAASGDALVGAKLGSELRYLVCVHDQNAFTGQVYSYATAEDARHAYQSVLKMPCVDWRLCDKDGWIPHIPTADSTCPVPAGVAFKALRRSGSISIFGGVPDNAWQLGFKHNRSPGPGDVVAWRPVAGGAA